MRPIASVMATGIILLASAMALAEAAVAQHSAPANPGRATATTTRFPGQPAFDYAFRFATAVPDDQDRPKAQEFVVRDALRHGRIDYALELAARVEGWRRGVLCAELATALAGAGRVDEARGLIVQADAIQAASDSWHRTRIAAHIATAQVAIGEVEQARNTAQAAGEAREYTGRSAAVKAQALAREGRFDEAMTTLAALDEIKDVYISWWRSSGYLDLAAEPQLTEPQRRQALDAARQSAESVPGWNQAEMLFRVATAYRDAGLTGPAREIVAAAEQAVLAVGGDSLRLRRASLRASLARQWAASGETEHAAELLAQAEALAEGSANSDRAVVFARIAVAYQPLADEAARKRLLARAFEVSRAQQNPRPRALALAAVCRVLGGEAIELDRPTREQLDSFLEVLAG